MAALIVVLLFILIISDLFYGFVAKPMPFTSIRYDMFAKLHSRIHIYMYRFVLLDVCFEKRLILYI